MKSKLLLLMAFALMVGQVDAQSQLKMLGKAAANRTKSEVKSEPQTQVVKKSPTAEQQQPRVQQ